MGVENVVKELVGRLIPEDQRAALYAELDGLDVTEATPIGATGYRNGGERVTYDATGNRLVEARNENGEWEAVETDAPEAPTDEAPEIAQARAEAVRETREAEAASLDRSGERPIPEGGSE